MHEHIICSGKPGRNKQYEEKMYWGEKSQVSRFKTMKEQKNKWKTDVASLPNNDATV